MKRSIFFASFLPTKASGSKPRTSPAIRQSNLDASNFVIGPMPLRPSRSACHVGSVPTPHGVMSPTPVTTTRRFKRPPVLRPRCPAGAYFASLRWDSMYLMASPTVEIFSASSSLISRWNSSSRAITSSTVSSESAPRSSTNEAVGTTSSASTPSCSTMIPLTFSSTFISIRLLWAALHVHTAVDVQYVTGDVSRRLARQEEHGGGDIRGRAEACHGNHLEEPLLRIGRQRRGHLGLDVAGRDRIDGHAPRGQLAGQRPGEPEEAGLRGRIVYLPCVPHEP